MKMGSRKGPREFETFTVLVNTKLTVYSLIVSKLIDYHDMQVNSVVCLN